MSIYQLAGFTVCAAVMAMVLRRVRPESATALIIAAGAVAVLSLLPLLGQIMSGVSSLASLGGAEEAYISQLLKVGGISLLTDFAAQTCRDAEEAGLARKVEFAGKVMLLALALPVMQALLEQILSLSC